MLQICVQEIRSFNRLATAFGLWNGNEERSTANCSMSRYVYLRTVDSHVGVVEAAAANAAASLAAAAFYIRNVLLHPADIDFLPQHLEPFVVGSFERGS